MQTSKAFRCTLPMLRDDQLTNLRRWAEFHCAQSIVFRDDRGNAVFVGLKANLRTCASFSRTVRTALCRLCIDVGAGQIVLLTIGHRRENFPTRTSREEAEPS